jgi:DNA helicase-2/ATP-dependent DNA helicase PcrA
MALERIINLPKRGIGASTMKRIHDHASMQGVPLLSAIQDMLTHKAFSPKLHKALDDFCQSMDIWRRQLASDDLVTLAKHVLDESGYTAMLQGDKTPEATTRLENLRELTHAMRQFETMPAFLEHVSLVMDHTEEQALEAVTIMTLHSAKGLEFDRVFLPGWEDGLFPHDRSLRTESRTALEEERRLAYVGLTRARQWACITHVGRRRLYYNWQDCTPSRFLSELPADHVEFLSSRGAPINPNKGGRFAGSKGSNSYTHSQSASPNGYINNQASYGQAHSVASQQSVETRRQNHVAEIPSYPSALVVGDRVFHEKFGYGAIRFLEAGRAEVAFEKSDVKQVMDRFLKKVPKKG